MSNKFLPKLPHIFSSTFSISSLSFIKPSYPSVYKGGYPCFFGTTSNYTPCVKKLSILSPLSPNVKLNCCFGNSLRNYSLSIPLNIGVLFNSYIIGFTNDAVTNNLTNTTTTDRPMAYWLFLCAGLVFGVVVVGGITRLTESGLSMVDWSLLHFKPPSTQEEWIVYFDKYKQSPEYIMFAYSFIYL